MKLRYALVRTASMACITDKGAVRRACYRATLIAAVVCAGAAPATFCTPPQHPSVPKPTRFQAVVAAADNELAMIDGDRIYTQQLPSAVGVQLAQLRNQEYEVTEHALEGLIDQKLIQAQAAKKGVSAQTLLQQEVDSKVPEPTDAEVKAAYDLERNQLNRPFDEIKAQLTASLKQENIRQARQAFYSQLWNREHVVILLRPPTADVSPDPARVRGNIHAPVMIVEFGDFECPYCRAAEATVKSVLANHPNDVAIAFRDFPLTQLHPQAESAAEAARCAGEQGQFWAYHDFLYASPGNLAMPAMLKEAESLKLDQKQFQSCLLSDKYSSQIQRDFQDGINAGVTGTPAFFINGAYLDGNEPQALFEQRIHEALATRATADAKRQGAEIRRHPAPGYIRRVTFGKSFQTFTPQKCDPSVQIGVEIPARSTHGGPM